MQSCAAVVVGHVQPRGLEEAHALEVAARGATRSMATTMARAAPNVQLLTDKKEAAAPRQRGKKRKNGPTGTRTLVTWGKAKHLDRLDDRTNSNSAVGASSGANTATIFPPALCDKLVAGAVVRRPPHTQNDTHTK